MSTQDLNNSILWETVRNIISEHVYGLMNESLFETDDNKDSSDKDNDYDNHDNDSNNGSKDNKKQSELAKQWEPQVIRALKDPKINNAPIAYAMHPELTKDGARSFLSKQVNGKRPFTDNNIVVAHKAINNMMNKLDESRMLTQEEISDLYEAIRRRS